VVTEKPTSKTTKRPCPLAEEGVSLSNRVSIVPKPVESCRFENHGFAVFLGAFSSGLSASVSSFFRFSSPALHQS
jgi:hypothetical protein